MEGGALSLSRMEYLLKFLSGDLGIDLPKAGWESYTIREDGEGGSVLVPI